MVASRFPVLRGPDAQQSRVQDNVQALVAPLAKALQNTPIMGAPSPAWIQPSPLNGFANLGGGFVVLRFHRDALGYVHIQGVVTNAVGCALQTAIFTLPLRYRPALSLVQICEATGGTLGSIEVRPTGDVNTRFVVAAGGYLAFVLDFLAED